MFELFMHLPSNARPGIWAATVLAIFLKVVVDNVCRKDKSILLKQSCLTSLRIVSILYFKRSFTSLVISQSTRLEVIRETAYVK